MAETVELSTPRCFAEASIRVRDKEEADMIIEAIPKVAQVGYVFVACEADKRKRISNPDSVQNIVHITSCSVKPGNRDMILCQYTKIGIDQNASERTVCSDRDRSGIERCCIDRPQESPVFSLIQSSRR